MKLEPKQTILHRVSRLLWQRPLWAVLCFGMVLSVPWLDCQSTSLAQAPQSLREEPKLPTHFGVGLSTELPDFRLHLFSQASIESQVRRGVVCLVRGMTMSAENTNVEEYTTDRWQTVADALRDMSLIGRKSQVPQIRVVQRDCIFQSELSYPSSRGAGVISGFSAEFLHRKLFAGDVIIISGRQ